LNETRVSLDEFDIGTSTPFHTARDPVNVPELRRWLDALGYVSPVHTELAVAQRSLPGVIVGPLAMLDVWTKPGLAYRRDVANPQGRAFDLLDEQGFTSSVAVQSELAQTRAVRLGELITSTITLEQVSPQKRTALGEGRFVTTRQDFLIDSEPVGYARTTVLKFRPPEATSQQQVREQQQRAPEAATPDAAASLDPARDALGTVTAGRLQPGDRLPALSLPVTATSIIAGALATSDFFDGHHDRDAAQRRGLPDIFMNIHTTLGIIERYVGSWLGPNVTWVSMSVRLGVPNHPGDEITIVGTVAESDADGRTTIAVRATNRLALHADATVEVRLPGSGDSAGQLVRDSLLA
jgi:hypothetical protein